MVLNIAIFLVYGIMQRVLEASYKCRKLYKYIIAIANRYDDNVKKSF